MMVKTKKSPHLGFVSYGGHFGNFKVWGIDNSE